MATVQTSVSEMTLNDNVNIEGDVFLNGTGGGINFPDGTEQTSAATPSWSQILPAKERFELVMNNEAVLDRETGLVWQKDTNKTSWYDWSAAVNVCYNANIGGRGGWRLPTVVELRTIIDPTQTEPALPEGNPFTNVKQSGYWSFTDASSSLYALFVDFNNGYILNGKKTSSHYVRAVRSAQ